MLRKLHSSHLFVGLQIMQGGRNTRALAPLAILEAATKTGCRSTFGPSACTRWGDPVVCGHR